MARKLQSCNEKVWYLLEEVELDDEDAEKKQKEAVFRNLQFFDYVDKNYKSDVEKATG